MIQTASRDHPPVPVPHFPAPRAVSPPCPSPSFLSAAFPCRSGPDFEPYRDLSTHLALRTSPGDLLSISLIRDGERRELSMELGERPDPRG